MEELQQGQKKRIKLQQVPATKPPENPAGGGKIQRTDKLP
jgi:hypothetical protein